METQRQFDKMMAELRQMLLNMAASAETMIDRAIAELVQRDEALAENVPSLENELNRFQIQIDDAVMTLLATHQPVARDLRTLLAASRIANELERVGDLVVNITENVHILAQQPPLKPLLDIPRMAHLARRMVRESSRAFAEGDVLLAQTIIMLDDQMDDLKDQIFRELLTYMMSDPHTIERAMAFILISRHLERIGDQSVNIAEDVIYMVQGRDVRHPRTERETD